MPDPAKRLVDELRYRIADPGTYLPRLINDVGAPRETVAGWGARAILAGLEDGTLGYVPAGQQLHRADFDRLAAERDRWKNHSTQVQFEADRLTAELATLKQHAAHLFAGVDAAYRFANKLDADCCGTYARQLRDAISKAGPAPVPGSSHCAQEPKVCDRVVQPLPPVDAAAGCDMTRDGHRCARLADHEDGCLFPPAADPEPRR